MFESHDQSAVEQLQRMAQWLEKRVARTEANDPELAQLKQAEREASAKVNSLLSEAEVAKLMQAHEHTVCALIRHVSSNYGA